MEHRYKEMRKQRNRDLEDRLAESTPAVTVHEYKATIKFMKSQGRDIDDFAQVLLTARRWFDLQYNANPRSNLTQADRLQCFQRIQMSSEPLLIVKPSLIKGAGLGVFVSDWYPYCPPGAVYGFVGEMVSGPVFPDGDSVHINKHKRLLLTKDHPLEAKHLHPANYINCPIRGILSADEYSERLVDPLITKQNLRCSNCDISQTTVKISQRLKPGTELLVRYGKQYTLPVPSSSEDDDSANSDSSVDD